MGFRLVDTNVQLTRVAAPLKGSRGRCRFARPDDEPAVRGIAGSSFTQSRFHLDPEIPNATADRLKASWAGNFFTGKRGDWMVVAEEAGEVCGFLQLLRKSSECLIIDLIAVAKEQQGKGLGKEMIAFAAHACLKQPAAMLVGTQIANFGSLALYTRLGFEISSASYVLHLHQRE